MHKSNYFANVGLMQVFLDAVFIIVSFCFSYWLSDMYTILFDITKYIWILFFYLPVCMLILGALKMYNKTTFNYYDRVLRSVFLANILTGMLLTSLMYYNKITMVSRLFIGTVVLISFLVISIERCIYIFILNKFYKYYSSNVIIVGVPSMAKLFLKYVRNTQYKINNVGYVQISEQEPPFKRKNLGSINNLVEILKTNVVDEVIFTLPKDYVGELEKYVHICEDMGLTVRIVFNFYDLKFSKTYISSIGPMPMLTYHSVSMNTIQLLLKRLIDIFGSIVGIFVTVLFTIFLFPIIKLDSPGPIFFTQNRVGKNGRLFKLIKFRTMHVNAHEYISELAVSNEFEGGYMFKMKNDPRITNVGRLLRKTSIDELPQFINVFLGHMSLVGTRPPTESEVELYKLHHYRRLSFKPGLTGMWQVSGRSEIKNFDEVVRLDTEYIDNWTIWLDIKIILKTILVVITKKGAH